MSGLVVDLFAGGGGASTGIEAALGRPVDIAINHSAVAIAVHTANHAGTTHFTSDVYEVDPIQATRGMPVDVLWASPDCTHHSKAKGSAPDRPRSAKLRSLAWVVVRWARAVRPRLIFVENVEEFRYWQRLDKNGRPIAREKGRTFREWCRQLAREGYEIEHRILDASRYGAPTKRKRLFIIARCDGLPIVWPTPTHGPGLLPFRTAGECIDWSLPTRSIFDRKKPLAEKTMHRIAEGIRRFVIENPRPFIVPVNHGGGPTRCHDSAEPLPTTTAARRSHAIVAPYLVNTRNGERTGQTPRVRDVLEPAPTVTAKGSQGAIAHVALIDMQRENAPRSIDEPLGTITTQGNRFNPLAVAFVAKHFGGVYGHAPDRPLDTVTARDHHSPIVANLIKFRGECNGASLDEPAPTITSQGLHLAECRAFLVKYFGSAKHGQTLFDGLHTVTTKPRFGLVVVDGQEYEIADVFLRMLKPHELLRCQFGDHAEGYDISAAKTQEAQTRIIGNSVPPDVVCALVRANALPALASTAELERAS